MKSLTHYHRQGIVLAIFFLLIFLSACSRDVEYALQNTSIAVEGAESVQAHIEMRSGDIALSGGAVENLLEAEFAYNNKNEPPQVDYRVIDGLGELDIEGSGVGSIAFSIGGKDNVWDLVFAETIPLALDVSISDSDADMDLSSLSLTQLNIGGNSPGIKAKVPGDQPLLTGVNIDSNGGRINLDLTGRFENLSSVITETNGAQIVLDLSGDWGQDLDVTLRGGTGNKVSLVLPQDVGVSANLHTSNAVSADGFTVNGNTYTNSAFGQSPVGITIHVTFERGNIELLQ